MHSCWVARIPFVIIGSFGIIRHVRVIAVLPLVLLLLLLLGRCLALVGLTQPWQPAVARGFHYLGGVEAQGCSVQHRQWRGPTGESHPQ